MIKEIYHKLSVELPIGSSFFWLFKNSAKIISSTNKTINENMSIEVSHLSRKDCKVKTAYLKNHSFSG